VDPESRFCNSCVEANHKNTPCGGAGIGQDLIYTPDYSICKRLGRSYCAIPKTLCSASVQVAAHSGKEVINNTWVSFPSWSEDSQFISMNRQYE